MNTTKKMWASYKVDDREDRIEKKDQARKKIKAERDDEYEEVARIARQARSVGMTI
jgi:hypothetical protein